MATACKQADERLTAILHLNVAVFLFAMPAVISKFADLSPMAVVVGRGLFAGLALWSALSLRPSATYNVSAKTLRITALLGVMYSLQLWAIFKSVSLSSPALAILCFCSYPLFTTFLEPIFFKTRLRSENIVSVVLVALGLAVVTLDAGINTASQGGILLGTFSGLLFALISLINKAALRTTSAVELGFFQNMFIMICSLPFLLLDMPPLTPTNIVQLLFMGVVCSAFGQTLFVSTFKRVDVQMASIFLSMEPVYAALLAYIFLGEQPTPSLCIGSLLLIGASVYSSRR